MEPALQHSEDLLGILWSMCSEPQGQYYSAFVTVSPGRHLAMTHSFGEVHWPSFYYTSHAQAPPCLSVYPPVKSRRSPQLPATPHPRTAYQSGALGDYPRSSLSGMSPGSSVQGGLLGLPQVRPPEPLFLCCPSGQVHWSPPLQNTENSLSPSCVPGSKTKFPPALSSLTATVEGTIVCLTF